MTSDQPDPAPRPRTGLPLEGLRILDITDPVNPTEVGFIDTTPYGGGGSWSNYPYFKSGMIIMTSMSEGLFVVKARPRNRLIS